MKNELENAKNLAKESVKESVFSLFGRESEIAQAQNSIFDTDFFRTYSPIYYFALFTSFALLVGSAISEFSFFEGLLALKLKKPILLIICTLACVVFLECAKYYILGSTLKQVFAIGRSELLPFFVAFSLVLSGLSMYGSIVGGGKLGIDTEKPLQVESKHDKEISQIRSEITEIKARNTWKGNTWIQGKDKALLHEKEAFLAKTQAQKETDLQTVQTENEANESTYQWTFGGLEILFWIVMIFVWYFRKRIAVESVLEQNESSQEQNQTRQEQNESSQVQNQTRQEQNESSQEHDGTRMVQIIHGKGIKHCRHCNTPFVANHKIQRFCSNECRKTNWERIRGKKLRLKKKKGVESPTVKDVPNVPNTPPVDLPKNGAKINGAKPQIKIFDNQ